MIRSFGAAIAVLWMASLAAPASAQVPATLKECYLRVAMEKTTADAVHLAREICDAAFNPFPRPLAVLSPKDGACSEWWFDHHGRHESRTLYCSFEETGEGEFRLACQYKGAKSFTYVELREEGDRYVRVGKLDGVDVGQLFKSLAGCIGHKARPAEAAAP